MLTHMDDSEDGKPRGGFSEEDAIRKPSDECPTDATSDGREACWSCDDRREHLIKRMDELDAQARPLAFIPIRRRTNVGLSTRRKDERAWAGRVHEGMG